MNVSNSLMVMSYLNNYVFADHQTVKMVLEQLPRSLQRKHMSAREEQSENKFM